MVDSAATGMQYRVPFWLEMRRWLLRTFFRQLFRLLMRVKITGLENIPAEGSYMIAHNHISLFEPPFILALWPVPPEAIAGDDVFYRPGQGLMVRAYGALPVHRDSYDRKVVERMLQLLAAGRPLLIAPEGGRSHTPGLRQARPGVAYLMDRASAPVLPVGIVGSTEDLLSRALRFERPPLEMRIGKPFVLPPIAGRGEERREARQQNADEVMRQIAALLPRDYRGYYV
jgi:1-acyl-sn-glycerol-3-phosphate acyltransferase